MSSVKDFESELKEAKGKTHGYPRDINFSFEDRGKTLRAELIGKLDKKDLRRFDPWTLACVVDAQKSCNAKISKIVFSLAKGDSVLPPFFLNYEALKRRISFLNINNENILFELYQNENKEKLYDKKSLFNRPETEVIRQNISERSAENKAGFLEKAFQAYLNGKDLEIRTNERLAILGEDFYQIKGKGFGILREFATGVFDKKIGRYARILPTEFVDIVTLNKFGKLAVIELKLDNPELEVISQILDYSLFFACYRKQLIPLLNKELKIKISQTDDFYCYVVNNHFHPRFNDILKFYNTGDKKYGFVLKKIVLGETTKI